MIRLICWVALALTLTALPAAAQSDESAMERLVQLLVKNGVLTPDQAKSLAAQARSEASAGEGAAGAASPGSPGGTSKPKPVGPGTVRVTHVPETVRKQIVAEVKQQVMQQATEEGWAEPNTIPGWTQRIRVLGDVRVRGEFDKYPRGNFNAFPDFNAINATSNGYDSNSGVNPPTLNSAQDRTRTRLRVRLGVAAQVTDWVSTEIRIATGSDRSPISTNQTLGAGGDFSKYTLWLDRAAIVLRPAESVTLSAGRVNNPFWTSDLVFDDDLGMDGGAANWRFNVADGLGGFLTMGGFPVFNTDFSFGSTNLTKTRSRDSWLLAIQGGTEWKPPERAYTARVALGFFAFTNIDGKLSSPCVAPTSYGSCDTDYTRAPWIQYGNTVFPVRSIVASSGATTAQPQFYGLASRFNLINLHAEAVYRGFGAVALRPEIDVVQNIGFNRTRIAQRGPVNNLGANNAFVGSGTGYMMRLTAGQLTLTQAWDWNTAIAYKYVGSDAVIDALTDGRFHLGGTNAKGYVLTGNLALGPNIWLTGSWSSTDAVSGPPHSIDTLVFDLSARF